MIQPKRRIETATSIRKIQMQRYAKICKVFAFHGHLPFRPGDIADAGLWSGCSTLHTSETQKSHAVDFQSPRPFIILHLPIESHGVMDITAAGIQQCVAVAFSEAEVRHEGSRFFVLTTAHDGYNLTWLPSLHLCPSAVQDFLGPRITTIQWPTGMICYDIVYDIV